MVSSYVTLIQGFLYGMVSNIISFSGFATPQLPRATLASTLHFRILLKLVIQLVYYDLSKYLKSLGGFSSSLQKAHVVTGTSKFES
jgi:hypothetical protein